MSLNYLPEGYELKKEINLVKDKRLAIWLNIVALIMVVIVIGISYYFKGVSYTRDLKYLWIMCVSLILYIVIHEITHGIVAKIFLPKEKLNFGITLTAAYCGIKTGYFSKKHYICVALAPIIIWGIVFGIFQFFVKDIGLFFVLTVLQAINISGGSGDIYCTYLTVKSLPDTLINDDGVSMRFYSKE